MKDTIVWLNSMVLEVKDRNSRKEDTDKYKKVLHKV